MENGECFPGSDLGIGVEEEKFNPANITIEADSFVAIAKRVSRSGLVFVRLREVKEVNSFVF